MTSTRKRKLKERGYQKIFNKSYKTTGNPEIPRIRKELFNPVNIHGIRFRLINEFKIL